MLFLHDGAHRRVDRRAGRTPDASVVAVAVDEVRRCSGPEDGAVHRGRAEHGVGDASIISVVDVEREIGDLHVECPAVHRARVELAVRYLHELADELDLLGRLRRAVEAYEIVRQIEGLLRFALPQFQKEGKLYVTICVGCTGGRHRSPWAFSRQPPQHVRRIGPSGQTSSAASALKSSSCAAFSRVTTTESLNPVPANRSIARSAVA